LGMLLPLGLLLKRKRGSWIVLTLCLVSICGIVGCGAGSGWSGTTKVGAVGTPKGSYDLSMTAKSGVTTHTTSITVTVQ
jgi:hypothetical protein